MRHCAIHIAKPFFLLVILPVLAVCLLQYRQLILQRRGKEKLEKELLQTVTIPKSSLRWAKPGKEIWVNDHLFDVKSYILRGDKYEFRGVFDVDETLIVKKLRQLDKQQTNTDLKLFSQLFKLLHSAFNEPEENSFYADNHSAAAFIERNHPLTSLFKLVNTPPPRG